MKRWAAVLCLAAVLLFSGCAGPALPGGAKVDELLRAPQLGGDYSELQTALNDWLGESATLKYPLTGELLSPFLRSDWDGDGVQDAAMLFTGAESPNVRLAILRRDADGRWIVCSAIEGLSDTVESVRFAKLQDDAAEQIIVGYSSAPSERYLAVYSCVGGQLEAILEQAYDQYSIEDFTGSGQEDLILMSTSGEDGAQQLELLTADRSGSFRRVAVEGLSPDRFSGCAALAAGTGSDGRHYLVLDGWTGVNGTNLASVLLCFNEKTQQLEPAEKISADELYETTLRNVPMLTSRDLNGNGTVDIPIQPVGAGLLNLSQHHRVDFISWMDYTSRLPEKSFGLLDEELGYYLALPRSWRGNLLVTDGPDENSMELRSLDSDTLYMTIRTAKVSRSAPGWLRLGIASSRQVQVRMEAGAPLPTSYEIKKSLYIL